MLAVGSGRFPERDRTMLCPVCRVEMFILEVDQVEADYCRQCKGIWLDPGELELLLEMAHADTGHLHRAISHGGHVPRGQKRRCPICRRKMFQLATAGHPPVVVDRCRWGHGLWLDDKELSQLIEAEGGSTETEALARLCGRMLRSDRSQKQGSQGNVGTDSRQ